MPDLEYYLLSPASHKGVENNMQTQDRMLDRYLNTNGRWSAFPPKKNISLLYWSSREEILKAAEIAINSGRDVHICKISTNGKVNQDRMINYNENHLPCLTGYIK
ncbi:hypothetical protein AB6G20_21795 [Providencia hangzhouensis]|uniref:hypothetical protein n=1 Tax=Providencia hangzhouensis TaxID=3031799 RepID=UPI0034DD9B44